MKIAIIAHSLYPIREPFAGGLEMITHALCKTLQKSGHTVHLYAHKDSDDGFEVKALDCDSRFPESVLCPMKNTDLALDMESMSYMSAMMEIAASDYDIVHNHSLHHIPITMGNLLNVPMVTTIHTPPFLYLQIGAYAVKQYNNQVFTMVSKSLHETWKQIVPKAKIVYNGIDLNRWNFVESPKGDYLMWYGRICPEKGTVEAIEAANLSGNKLILAGPISNEEYFRSEVEPLLRTETVEYIGHLSQKEVGRYLGNAQLMLFTSTWDEPYGLTLAESLACGTPVIAFSGGATHEILTDETGVIVPKGNRYDLAKAIPSAKILSRRKCRERAVEFCSNDSMMEGYYQLYKSLLSQRKLNIKLVS